MFTLLLTSVIFMNTFVDSARSRRTPPDAMTYQNFRDSDFLKAFSVRLPVTTIAKVEALHGHLARTYPRVWASKQELLFDLLEHALTIWANEESDRDTAHSMLERAATMAMQLKRSGFITNENSELEGK
jgi:hypothetical protein